MKKIAVIGSINMDMTAESERIPLPGETVIADRLHYAPGGKGANQAVAAARLGGRAAMFGCVGNDDFGRALIRNFEDQGVDARYISVLDGIPTGLAMITVSQGENAITVIPGANHAVDSAYIDEVLPVLRTYEIILLQNEIPEETIRYAVQKLRTPSRTILYNPAPARSIDAELFEMVDYLTPNEHEAVVVMNEEEADISQLVRSSQGKLIVTLGREGVLGYADGKLLHIPAIPAHVADTTGAGDCFNGALSYALSCGWDLPESIRFANTAAGISTEKLGAQTGMPRIEEVEKRREEHEK